MKELLKTFCINLILMFVILYAGIGAWDGYFRAIVLNKLEIHSELRGVKQVYPVHYKYEIITIVIAVVLLLMFNIKQFFAVRALAMKLKYIYLAGAVLVPFVLFALVVSFIAMVETGPYTGYGSLFFFDMRIKYLTAGLW
ncbi:MAG: hypothetical protein ACI4GD_11260 [Lachnospiraceae bacterium]